MRRNSGADPTMISVRMLPVRAGRAMRGVFAATATVIATAPAATAPRRLRNPITMIAPGLLPRTIQVCIHCQQRPAGFWVHRTGGTVVRRPWCLSCCQGLDRDRCDVIPFGD
jgi:hypothetical protein